MPKIYPEEIKQQAQDLRRKGFTYSEIQKLISHPVPKNTFTGWFKNIFLSIEAQNRIVQKIEDSGSIGRATAWRNRQQKHKDLKISIFSKVNSEIEYIDPITAKIILAVLYLGEGGKTQDYVTFGNSDPRIIELFVDLLRRAFDIDEKRLRGRVQCRADQNIPELEQYWSNLTKISLSQLHKASIDSRTIGKPTKRIQYKGVFVISYYSNVVFFELKYINDIIYNRLIMGL